MQFLNVFITFAFIKILKKKIDYVVYSSQANENEEEEVYISKYTLMFQAIPRTKMKYQSAVNKLTFIFKEIYKDKLIKVNIMPELRTLDYFLLKKKEYS